MINRLKLHELFLLMALVGVIFLQTHPCKGSSNKIQELTSKNFGGAVSKRDKPVLVKFGAMWCGPCRTQDRILDTFQKQYKGKVAIKRVDIDKEQKLASQFKIFRIPTLVLFYNGKQVERYTGVLDHDELEVMINKKYLK